MKRIGRLRIFNRSTERTLSTAGKASLRTTAGSLFLALIVLSDVIGQTTQKTVLFIRNVQVADGPDKPTIKADVLVNGSVISRVDATTKIPADAISIDGGGNILTVKADGSIQLTQVPSAVAAAASTSPAVLKASDEEKIRFKEAVFDTAGKPDKTSRVPQNPSPAAPQAPAENLAQDVTDPTAPLTTITFQNRYVPSLWGINDQLNEFSLQVVKPYKMAGHAQIFRAVIPYFSDTASPERRGMGDVALANLTLFPRKGFIFAVGGVVTLGSNKGPGVDTFSLGPAVAAVAKRGKILFGFLNQNQFSFHGDIKVSLIQPIFSYTFNPKVSFALGDTQTTIDWNKGDVVSLPLSGQINYIVKWGKQPIRLFINPQYSFINSLGQRKWTVGAGFALIIQ